MPLAFSLIKDLLFPPCCAACGKLLAPLTDTVLCTECAALWARERTAQCEECFLPMEDCRCVPANMAKRGVTAHVKLAPYGAQNTHSVTARMLLGVKKHPDKRLFAFLAKDLAPGVRAAIAASDRTYHKNGLPPPETVLCFLPRNRRAVRRYGFDQAVLLAKALGKELEIPVVSLLLRKRDTAPQKTLSARARAANLSGAFQRSRAPIPPRVILVDDIVTTGAGMAEAAKMLENSEIIAVSVAFTKKAHEKSS